MATAARNALVTKEPVSISFGVLTKDEVLKLSYSFFSLNLITFYSVASITNPVTIDTLGQPVRYGLADPRLGASGGVDSAIRFGSNR